MTKSLCNNAKLVNSVAKNVCINIQCLHYIVKIAGITLAKLFKTVGVKRKVL